MTAQSVTFDPFMYLSVPIPVRNEKMVEVVMLPRIRTRYFVTPDGVGAEDGGKLCRARADLVMPSVHSPDVFMRGGVGVSVPSTLGSGPSPPLSPASLHSRSLSFVTSTPLRRHLFVVCTICTHDSHYERLLKRSGGILKQDLGRLVCVNRSYQH